VGAGARASDCCSATRCQVAQRQAAAAAAAAAAAPHRLLDRLHRRLVAALAQVRCLLAHRDLRLQARTSSGWWGGGSGGGLAAAAAACNRHVRAGVEGPKESGGWSSCKRPLGNRDTSLGCMCCAVGALPAARRRGGRSALAGARSRAAAPVHRCARGRARAHRRGEEVSGALVLDGAGLDPGGARRGSQKRPAGRAAGRGRGGARTRWPRAF
jgi:hypothetical protein